MDPHALCARFFTQQLYADVIQKTTVRSRNQVRVKRVSGKGQVL